MPSKKKSSTVLMQKASGYMLAAANAIKRENNEKTTTKTSTKTTSKTITIVKVKSHK